MKFCKECKYFEYVATELSIPLCIHPKSDRDKVWGVHAPCISMRERPYVGLNVDRCGPDAEWYEKNEEGQEG